VMYVELKNGASKCVSIDNTIADDYHCGADYGLIDLWVIFPASRIWNILTPRKFGSKIGHIC
jgi:hypothetical protein